MENKQQSSIDWLVSILNKSEFSPVLTDEEIQLAKAMHEDEIRDSHFDGSGYNNWDAFYNNPDKLNESYNKAKKYYNEIFGGGNE